ncbi:MAG: hypothetical protein ACK55O_09525 [Phycisphaerales bacterium]
MTFAGRREAGSVPAERLPALVKNEGGLPARVTALLALLARRAKGALRMGVRGSSGVKGARLVGSVGVRTSICRNEPAAGGEGNSGAMVKRPCASVVMPLKSCGPVMRSLPAAEPKTETRMSAEPVYGVPLAVSCH